MKSSIGYRIAFIIPFLSVSFIAGCSPNSTTIEPKPSPLPAGPYHYQFEAANLRPLDTSNGRYVLWLHILGDSSAKSVPLIDGKYSNGSLVFTDTIELPNNLDSILDAYVNIEPPGSVSIPSNPLIAGQFQSDSGYSFLSAVNAGGIGDFSKAAGSVVFTTSSSDTNRAQQEFYLMKFVNGVPASSMSNLPIAPVGWRYGLWVVDSSFYPIHQFFYGSFTNPNGLGSDSSKAEFPFPGGYNPAPLNDPGASLKVTLEPDFSVAYNKPIGPSRIVLLSLKLRQFIYFNQSIDFQNVWSNSSPSGILKIWR
jgi:hypothetical protein